MLGLALIVWSLLVRWVAAAASDGYGFYFPDSWNYVALPSQGQSHPFHGDFIYRLWSWLLPGSPTEASVIRLHQLLGMLAVLIVWLLLRRLVAEPIAFGAALVLAAQPLTLFFERTILTEAVALFLVVAVLAGLAWMVRARGVALLVSACIVGASSGTLVALRPASRLAAVAPLLIAGAVLILRAWRSEFVRGKRMPLLALALLIGSLFPAPLYVRSQNQQAFGTSSLTPAGGTAVLAWWGWRLDCPSSDTLTVQARSALDATCERDEPQRQLMWVDPTVNASMQPHDDFALTQQQLSGAAQQAMVGSPVYTARRVVSKSLDHAVRPIINLERFQSGHVWGSRAQSEPFPTIDDWFGGPAPTSWSAEPGLFGLVRQSARLPGLLTLVSLLASLALAIRWLRRPARSSIRDALAAPAPRLVMLIASLGMVVGNEAVVALGGVPIFRYWVPVLPAIAIAVAICVDYALGSSAPQSTG